MQRSLCFAVSATISILGCAAQPATEDAEPLSREELPVLVANAAEDADASDDLAVGAYDHADLRLAPGFVQMLAARSDDWLLRVQASEYAFDLASPTLALGTPLDTGSVMELVSEAPDGVTTTIELRIGPPSPEEASIAPSPMLEPTSTGCTVQCNGSTDAATFSASTCGACGSDKKRYEYRKRSCTVCGVLCNGVLYGGPVSCGPWQTWFGWCDYC